MEDLDRANSSPRHEARQLADLAASASTGTARSSARASASTLYDAAIDRLRRGRAGVRVLLHPAGDPRGGRRAARRPSGAYSGTCRDLADARARAAPRGAAAGAAAAGDGRADHGRRRAGRPVHRRGRRRRAAPQRRRAGVQPGRRRRRRRAGRDRRRPRRRPAAVDAAPGAAAAPARAARPSRYVHVPLVVGADGERLAKRHGAVTLEDLAGEGVDARRCAHRRWPRRSASRCRPGGRAQRSWSPGSTSAPSRAVAGRRSRWPTCNDPGRDRRDDDLDRVLGYRDAVDERRGVTELGPDLLVVPFWTPPVLPRRSSGPPSSSASPPIPTTRCRATRSRWRRSARALYQLVQDDLGARIWPQLQRGLAAHRLPRPARRLRHPLRDGRAGVAARAPRRRPGVGVGEARRRPRGRRAAVPAPRASTTPPCRSGRCWPGRRSSPTRTRWRRCGGA